MEIEDGGGIIAESVAEATIHAQLESIDLAPGGTRPRRTSLDTDTDTDTDTDPDRASVTIALQAAADQIVDACGSTGDDSDGGGIARAVLAGLLPARRPRISARKVKCPMSRYGTAQNETRPLSSRSFNRLDITVPAAIEKPTALPPSPANTDRHAPTSSDSWWQPTPARTGLPGRLLTPSKSTTSAASRRRWGNGSCRSSSSGQVMAATDSIPNGLRNPSHQRVHGTRQLPSWLNYAALLSAPGG
ncbi:hypothetical protein [Streptomyces sp. NPDC056713]|uniref:hypothetical protein n=1 Tax=Streptomyces sp. NPDC056713 TaxID=3345921 RepID=UPI0036B01B9B